MTTQAAFLAQVVSTLSVTGVNRQYTAPPASISTADMPLSFPWGFRRVQAPLTMQAHGGWPELYLDFVIVVEPWAQDTPPANYAAVLAIGDALDAALTGAVGTVGKGRLRWEIRGGDQVIEVAGIRYWGILATLDARG